MHSNVIKCIIILSTKSSGSSALQNLLSKLPQVNHISKTRHFEYETLYWTKAASVLGLPQVDMLDSEVPISKKGARLDLINLLSDNLDSYTPPKSNDELIFGGWKLLCENYSPVFLEKSPHHLHQWSALELINECIERIPEVDFLIVGLVRNPMAILYSAWDRWKSIPEQNQYEWFTAYRNLLRFKDLVKDKLVIIRYEDMVNDTSCLKEVFEFIGLTENYTNGYLHSNSIEKWNKDKLFGFKLSEEVKNLAEKFGYSRKEMDNDSSIFWPIYRHVPHNIYRNWKRIKRTLRFI